MELIKSKIFFTLSILFVLISLTCVYAADNQTENIAVIETESDFDGMLQKSIEDNSSEVFDDELKSANDDDKLTSQQLSTLSVLFSVNNNYYKLYDDFEGSTGSLEGIEISKSNIVIDGQGHFIKGDGRSRLLTVSGSNVTLKNIIFINGFSLDSGSDYGFGYGGAVYFNNYGTVQNCTFINNTSPDGGAVCFARCQGNVTDCHFINNTADVYGGAVYMSYGSISNCDFKDNHANSYGGAVFIDSEGSITNSKFINNSARLTGGAVFFSNEVTIDYCEFMNNTARRGGAVLIEESAKVLNSIFTLNNANEGAAIYSNNNLETEHCTFQNNRSDNVVSKSLSSSGTNTYLPYTVNRDLISVTEEVACGQTVRIIASATFLGSLLNEDAVTISINNKTYVGKVANGKATIELPNLNAGSYSENITYDGGDKYDAPSKAVMFNVSKKPVIVYASVYNITYGQQTNIHTAINGEGPTLITTGEITIYLDNVLYTTVKITDGIDDVKIGNINVGEHVVNITYDGGVNYTKAYNELKFTVSKANSKMIISNVSNCTHGDSIAINIDLSRNDMPIDEVFSISKLANKHILLR